MQKDCYEAAPHSSEPLNALQVPSSSKKWKLIFKLWAFTWLIFSPASLAFFTGSPGSKSSCVFRCSPSRGCDRTGLEKWRRSCCLWGRTQTNCHLPRHFWWEYAGMTPRFQQDTQFFDTCWHNAFHIIFGLLPLVEAERATSSIPWLTIIISWPA